MIFVCCHGDAIFLHIFVLFSFFPPTLYEYGDGICALFSSATPSFWYFYPSRLMTRRPLDDAMETHGRRRRIEARKMDVWLGWRAGERLGEGLARVRSPAGAALMEGKGGLGCYFFGPGGSRRTVLSAMTEAWFRDGGGGISVAWEANTKEKLETRLEIRVPSSPLGGFSRFKLERGKIPGWKGQEEVAVGSGWLSSFFPCLSLSTHTPRIQRGLVFLNCSSPLIKTTSKPFHRPSGNIATASLGMPRNKGLKVARKEQTRTVWWAAKTALCSTR